MIESGDSQTKNDIDEAEKKSTNSTSEGAIYAKYGTNFNVCSFTGSKRNSKKAVDKKEGEKETTEHKISNTSTPLRCVKLAFYSACLIFLMLGRKKVEPPNKLNNRVQFQKQWTRATSPKLLKYLTALK